MSRSAYKFKETEVTRAIRAVRKADQIVGKVIVRPGEIEIIVAQGGEATPDLNPLDQWKASRADQA